MNHIIPAMAQKSLIQSVNSVAQIRALILRACKDNDYSPFEELIELAKAYKTVTIDDPDCPGQKLQVKVPELDTDQRIRVATELAQYLAPKLKAIAVEGQVESSIEISVRRIGEESRPSLPAELLTESKTAETQRILADAVIEQVKNTKSLIDLTVAKEIEEEADAED